MSEIIKSNTPPEIYDVDKTINISLLMRTIKSLSNLIRICSCIKTDAFDSSLDPYHFNRNALITCIAHVSDNLTDLSKEFGITGQDIRDADHGQSCVSLQDIGIDLSQGKDWS